jgi:hypothetical protein
MRKSMLLFWVVTSCGLVCRCQRFGGIYCFHLQGWSWMFMFLWSITLVGRYPTKVSQEHTSSTFRAKDHHWLDTPTWALASLRTSISWSIRLLLLQISWQSFPGWGCQPHAQPPGYRGGPMFSVRVVFLSRLVPISKRQGLAFCSCMT